MILPWHLYLMAALYFVAGVNHFRRPDLYIRIIPPFFPNPKLLNTIAGAAEILLAVFLCFPTTSTYAAWGIVIMLFAIFPANLYMLMEEKASLGIPKWLRLLRLPLQLFLILWAFHYTGFIF